MKKIFSLALALLAFPALAYNPAPGSNNQIIYNKNGNFAAFTMGGDCVVTPLTGIVICTKSNGVNLAPSATTDATNASNIGSGSLALPRIAAIGSNTFLGNVTGGSAAPVALTAAQVATPILASSPAKFINANSAANAGASFGGL